MNFLTPSSFIVIVPLLITLSSCNEKTNDIIYKEFEEQFISTIAKNNAVYFEYEYDGLTPQKSYLVNGKVKFLKFRHGPQAGYVEVVVYFNLYNDSIEKVIHRQKLPKSATVTSNKLRDTLFVIYPNKLATETYFDNEIIEKRFRKDILQENERFIYDMKIQTENEFSKK